MYVTKWTENTSRVCEYHLESVYGVSDHTVFVAAWMKVNELLCYSEVRKSSIFSWLSMISCTFSVDSVDTNFLIHIKTLYQYIYQNSTINTIYIVIYKLLWPKKTSPSKNKIFNFFLKNRLFWKVILGHTYVTKWTNYTSRVWENHLKTVHGCARPQCLRCHLKEGQWTARLQRSLKKLIFFVDFRWFLVHSLLAG